MSLFFIWRKYPHVVVLRAWMNTNRVTREQLLTPAENNQDKDIPLMFITTYSRANLNFKELFSKHWSHLGISSATRELGKQDFMITYRKPLSLKDMLVRAKIAQPRTTSIRVVIGPTPANIVYKSPNQGELKIGPLDLCWFKDLIFMKYSYGSIEMDNRKNRKGILELFWNFNLL